jgi:hypothetical protein
MQGLGRPRKACERLSRWSSEMGPGIECPGESYCGCHACYPVQLGLPGVGVGGMGSDIELGPNSPILASVPVPLVCRPHPAV